MGILSTLKNRAFWNWKNTTLVLLGTIAICFFLFRTIGNLFNGFKTTDSGLKYRFITKLKGRTPVQGDAILLNYAMISTQGDTLINNLRNDTFMEINVYSNKPNNELMEGLFMMGSGDIAEFRIPSDSLRKKIKNDIIENLPERTEVVFLVKVEQVLNYDQFTEYKVKKRLKIYEKEDKAIDAYAAKIKKNWILDSFQRVKYYIENKTDKPRFKDGDKISFHARVTQLNGSIDIDSKMEGRKLEIELGKVNYRISAFDKVMYFLAEGESGMFLVPSEWAYGAAGKIGLPSFSPLSVEISEIKKLNP